MPTRVLVVEDEWLIADLVARTLSGVGLTVMGPMPSLAAAMQLLALESPDLALLDMNLRGESVAPLADRLEALRIPFIVMSGFRSSGLAGRLAQAPLLAKPFRPAELLAAIATICPTSS